VPVEGRDVQQVCTVLLAGLAWLLPLLLLLWVLGAAAAAAVQKAQVLLQLLYVLLVQQHGVCSQQLQEQARNCRITQHLAQLLHSFLRQLRHAAACCAISQLAAKTHKPACSFLQPVVDYVHLLDLAVCVACLRPQCQQQWGAALQLLQ
jgi:hypothetical protein